LLDIPLSPNCGDSGGFASSRTHRKSRKIMICRMLTFCAIVTGALPLYGLNAPAAGSDSLQWKQKFAKPSEFYCGPYNLYVFLRLAGCECSYSKVYSALGPSPEGTSLKRLYDVALGFDVPVRMVRGDFDALQAAQKPVLVFFPKVSVQNPDLGHYAVVYGETDAGLMRIVDGESARRGTLSRERLAQLWDGHCLILDKTPTQRTANILLLSLDGLVALAVIAYFFSRSKRGSCA
jgi:hypothetical protein